MSSAPLAPHAPPPALWRLVLAGLSASLVGIGLARFAYTPLLPPLIQAHWFASADVVTLGAANLAGYLVGAMVGRPLGARLGHRAALRAMMLLVTAAFLACAWPLSVGWYFGWRFASGVAGGAIMVLAAGTLLPHVAPARRGITSGAIFLGLGLGIEGSGTLVPLLLHEGLRATWFGLAAISALFTAASWFAWPRPAHAALAAQAGAAAADAPAHVPARAVRSFYAQYALMAFGFVPTMLFLVDFVARGLGEGTRSGALAWVFYGVGAIVGPPLYGLLGDRLGGRVGLRAVLAVQALAMLVLGAVQGPVEVALLAVVLGSFPPGVVPLALARVHELEPRSHARQQVMWSRATILFAATQAIAGYANSAMFNASGGDYRRLFLIAAAGYVASVVVDLVPLTRAADRKPAAA